VGEFIDAIPILFLGIGILLALSAVIEIGYRLGSRLTRERGLSKHPVEATATTAILSLMAFMMGFVFAGTSARRGKLVEMEVEESNIVSTAFLRADFLPEKEADEARRLLRQYLEIRTKAVLSNDLRNVDLAIKQSVTIQKDLWDVVTRAKEEGESADVRFFASVVNDLIDIDLSRRQMAFGRRLPPTIWYSITFLAVLAIVMLGMSSGLHGRRSRLASTALIVAFSIVFLLIVDLDRPKRTLFKLKHFSSVEALESMGGELDVRSEED